jgi:hypothetical protein
MVLRTTAFPPAPKYATWQNCLDHTSMLHWLWPGAHSPRRRLIRTIAGADCPDGAGEWRAARRLPAHELKVLMATWWPLILIAIGVSFLLRNGR